MAATTTTTRTARPRTQDPGALRMLAAAAGNDDDPSAALEKAARAGHAAQKRARLDADASRAAADPLVRRLMDEADGPAVEAAGLAEKAAARAAQAAEARRLGNEQAAEALLAEARRLNARSADLHATALDLRDVAHEALHRRRGMVLRIRAQAVPVAVLGMLWAGAALGQLAPYGGPSLAGLYLAIATVWWWKRGQGAQWAARRRRRRYTTLVALAGAGWAWLACTAGAGGWRAALLWAGGYALAAPHWRRVHIPDPPAPGVEVAEPDLPPPVEVVERLTPVEVVWNEWVACPGGPADGAELSDRQLTKNGEKWLVCLVRDKQNYRALKSKAYEIAGRMGLKSSQVDFDPHPDGEHLAYLIVTLDRAGSMESLPYPGADVCFDPATGLTYWGRWPDGELMSWQAFHPERGACSGAILGNSGSGKSRLIEQLFGTWMRRAPLIPWMIDPQHGSSLPTLRRHADWAVVGMDVEEIGLLLRAADIVGETRTMLNGLAGEEGRTVHPISMVAPVLGVVIDECHKVFDANQVGRANADKNIEIADRIAREYRKAGVFIILASQHSDLKVFGGSEVLRMSVTNYNTIVMRLKSNIAKNLIAGFKGNAESLPLRGWAYYQGEEGGREIPGRAWHAEPVLDELYADLPGLRLETAVRDRLDRELGGAYARRHDAAEDAYAHNAARLFGGWDIDPSTLATIAAEDPAVAARVGELVAPRAGQIWTPPPTQVLGPTGTPAAPARKPAERTTTTGTTLRTVWRPLLGARKGAGKTEAESGPATAATPAVPARMSPASTDIYRLIPAGRDITTAEILPSAGCSEVHFHRAVNKLVEAGLVVRVRKGVYRRAS